MIQCLRFAENCAWKANLSQNLELKITRLVVSNNKRSICWERCFFHPTEFLRGLNDGNPWKLLIFIFQMSANLSFTASKIIRHLVFQYSIGKLTLLVSCLLMSSVKKNNYLACTLNFSLNLACCSVDYLSQTVHFCLHYNYMQFIIPILVLFFVGEIHLAGISTSSLLNIVFLRQVLWKHMALL